VKRARLKTRSFSEKKKDRRHVEFFQEKKPPQNSTEEKNYHQEKSHERIHRGGPDEQEGVDSYTPDF